MDNVPQYVRDFLNNYYELTRRLLDVIDAPEHIFIYYEDTAHDKFYDFDGLEDLVFDDGVYKLFYKIYDYDYLYWWRGPNGISLNLTLGNLFVSGNSGLIFHERKGVINYNFINRLNELLNMNDEEFALYIKIMGIAYETEWRNNV